MSRLTRRSCSVRWRGCPDHARIYREPRLAALCPRLSCCHRPCSVSVDADLTPNDQSASEAAGQTALGPFGDEGHRSIARQLCRFTQTDVPSTCRYLGERHLPDATLIADRRAELGLEMPATIAAILFCAAAPRA